MPFQFQPMPLLKRAAPFDDPEWIFELKYDGFRALAVIEHGRANPLYRVQGLSPKNMQNPGNDRAAFCVFMSSSPHFLEKCIMRRRKQNILLNLLLGTGAYLLYSKRHQLGDIGDLRDRARESYETASRRIGRASDALRGKDHAVVRTATASLMGVGVGVGIGMLLAPASGQKTRADISEKVKDVREKVRDRSSRKPQGASGTYGP